MVEETPQHFRSSVACWRKRTTVASLEATTEVVEGELKVARGVLERIRNELAGVLTLPQQLASSRRMTRSPSQETDA